MSSKNDAYTNLTKPKHALQLCLYSLLFNEQYGCLPAEARIESLINRDEEFALTLDQQAHLHDIPSLFDEGLHTLIENLLDDQSAFEHDPDAKYCQFCT